MVFGSLPKIGRVFRVVFASELAVAVPMTALPWCIGSVGFGLFISQSARNNLDFIKRQYEIKKQEFEEIQDSIAIFKDQNLNITSTLYQNQLTRLQSQFTVISTVFQELAGQVEQAKIQVNKDTPIFTIIEPVSVPLERSKPKRAMMIIIGALLGSMFSVGWVLVKPPVKQTLKELRS